MSETTNFADLSDEGQIAALDALLSGDTAPATETAEGTDATPEVEATAPPEGDQQESNEAEAKPEETPSIDPPASWSKDAREKFAAMPPELQEYVTQRETQRDTEVRRVQNEAAEARKIADAAAQERAFFAQHLAPTLQSLTNQLQADFSPQRMAELAAKDPNEYVKVAAQRDLMVQQQHLLANEQARQAQLLTQQEASKLFEAMPEWREPEKFREAADRLRSFSEQTYGFTRAEIDAITDSRALRVLEDARKYREQEAARKAPASKVVQPQAPRVLNARQRSDNTATDAKRAETLRNIARSGSAEEQLAALESLL